METEKSFSGEEAEKDFCGRLFFLAAIFPFSNEKACLGVTAKTDFFYRLSRRSQLTAAAFFIYSVLCDAALIVDGLHGQHRIVPVIFHRKLRAEGILHAEAFYHKLVVII